MKIDTEKKQSILKKGIVGAIVSAFLIVLDQLTKYLAVTGLKDEEAFVLWDGVFELRYLENRGAAFGIMQGQKWLLVIFTVLILIGLVYVFLKKIPADKRFFVMNFTSILFFSGAIGNFIDRIVNDYVTDFFYFCLIDFPIFNVADIYVTVAAFLLIVFGLFYYKDDDWEKIFPQNKKKTAK